MAWSAPLDGPVFCGDAIADPLTGLEAASAVADSLSRGGGELIQLSMAAVAATYAALPTIGAGLPSIRRRHRRSAAVVPRRRVRSGCR